MEELRREKPLVHHITNTVTINDCANITLCLGGLPVMANAPQEVGEMVSGADALLLNIGTLTRTQEESMFIAGEQANHQGIPVVLDPVGAGATKMRTEAAQRLLDELDIAVVVGNAAEVSVLAGLDGEIRGVESIGAADNLRETAKDFARDNQIIIVVTGEEDWITDGTAGATVTNGSSLMGELVGTGCMVTSAVACFAAIECSLESVVTGVVAFDLAGEIAGESARGPGSFRSELFDAARALTHIDVEENARVRWDD